MSSDWPHVRLGDHIDSCLGKMLDAKKNKGLPQPYLGNSNVRWGTFDLDDLAEMRFEPHEEERYSLERGDLVVCEGGEPGRCAIWTGTKGVKIQKALHRIRPKSTLNNYYLYYWFRCMAFRGLLEPYFTGTTIKHLTGRAIASLEIQLPPYDTQLAIVEILKPLDATIENLRHQNTTLEAIAQRLFRSWFVNFDPVHAKAAGREPEAMSAETAALFPSEFEESALGLIPKGWDITTLGVVADFIKGRSYKSEELKPSPVALVTLKSFQRGGGFRLDGFKPYVGKYKDDQVVIPGECIVALTDVTQNAEVIGRPAMVYPSDFKNVASLDVGILRPKNKAVTKEFLYCLLREQRYVGHILGHTTGTTVLHLSKDGVPSYQFAIPPSGVVRRFCDIASPLFKTIEANVLVANRLTQLRDHLLPRLISGKLSLADAEAALAAVKPEVELAQGHSPA